MSTQPTDAEIDAVTLEVLGYAALDKNTNETARMIARAVLAKWGQPALAGELVAWEATVPGYIKYVTQSRYERFSAIAKGGYKPFKCSNCTTSQPTQVQAGAVPLTLEQIAEGFAKRSRHIGMFMGGVRFAEQHHGIKGG